MRLLAMASPISTALLLLTAAVTPSQAAIAAWWNGIGPQIILQNETTGAIRHSPCNSFDTAFYSYDDDSELPLALKPKNGTALAGVGYWNEQTTIASVYYVEKGNRIANALLECNMSTGRFRSRGNWIISGESLTIHENTTLAALLLGAVGGYRVYYYDVDMLINEIGYVDGEGWTHRGAISKDPQAWPALAAFHTGRENITVASIRDAENVEVVRYHADELWRISTFPKALAGDIITHETNVSGIAINQTAPANFTMPAWDPKPQALAMSIDSAFTRSVWYIGSDKALHAVRSKAWAWGIEGTKSEEFWPLADSPGADLAIACRSGISSSSQKTQTTIIRIYYFVKGLLTELRYEDGSWKASSALSAPVASTKTPISPVGPGENSEDAGGAASEAGLSAGAKAGVAIGVVLGVVALAALGASFYLMRRRRTTAATNQDTRSIEKDQMVSPENSPSTVHATPQGFDQYTWEKDASPPQYPAQLDTVSPPTELAARPMYELPSVAFAHELGDSQPGQDQSPRVSQHPDRRTTWNEGSN